MFAEPPPIMFQILQSEKVPKERIIPKRKQNEKSNSEEGKNL